jgi:hypothetical protein
MAGRTLTANNEGQVTTYEKVEKLESTLPPAWFLSIAEAARVTADAKQVERGTTHHTAARQTMDERTAAESPSATITGRTSSGAATRLFQLTREFLPVSNILLVELESVSAVHSAAGRMWEVRGMQAFSTARVGERERKGLRHLHAPSGVVERLVYLISCRGRKREMGSIATEGKQAFAGGTDRG